MYKGEQVPEGKKSLSYKLVLRKDGSMTDEEADAVVAKVLKALAEKNGLKIVEDPQTFETEEYAIAVKKGNTELLDKINETLSEMKASGEIEQLAMEYDEKLAENNQ